jgi:hypothetical protein
MRLVTSEAGRDGVLAVPDHASRAHWQSLLCLSKLHPQSLIRDPRRLLQAQINRNFLSLMVLN